MSLRPTGSCWLLKDDNEIEAAEHVSPLGGKLSISKVQDEIGYPVDPAAQ
ncbi:hypothetical protein HER21_31570 [Pseudomonas sp. BGM005]|nr:hypothetical protein [Pseudomonas sp. BG5]